MDVPRKSAARNRKIRQIVIGVVVLAAVGVTTKVLGGLKPAAPSVERAQVWMDGVKRGPMLRQVRGLGTLVPIDGGLVIPAETDGRVEQRLALPGTIVTPGTLLLVLSNPELEQATIDAEWKVKAAEAELNNLKVNLQSDRLTQQAAAATVETDAHTARLEADRDAELSRFGLTADIQAKKSAATAQDLENRNQIEKKRLDIGLEAIQAQLAVQQATVEQLRALCNLKRSQLASLRVRAGVEGVLQEVPVEVGQRVAAGTILAKVAQPTHLKAQLRIPETQAKDVQLGQKASIDTHNGVIAGHVVRIDPSVIEGTRTVDVKLDDALPPGAVPDLSVDGTITIERLSEVLYVGRPTLGQANSKITLFKLVNGGKEAVRVPVTLGRASVSTIEVVEGLQPGDEVILSDMSQYDGFDRIKLQ